MKTIIQLTYQLNRFGGVVVSPDSLPESAEDFDQALKDALLRWPKENAASVWLEIPKQKAQLIPVATGLGFEFHHCKPESLMLTYSLVEDIHIPPFATHYAGVGGVVLNRNQELLVVVEQADREDRPNYYKLPGGALLEGEHIVDAARREVREETGIETQFESLVCVRHWHGYRYGKSDLYFVCRLTPLDHTIASQLAEIFKCQWMPVDEFLNNESVGIFSKRIVECALAANGLVSGWLEGYDQDPATREILLPPR